MNRSAKDFVAIVELAEGNHEYKFHVDGEWVNDPNSPVAENGEGTTIINLSFLNGGSFLNGLQERPFCYCWRLDIFQA
jgi:hypothetical protein